MLSKLDVHLCILLTQLVNGDSTIFMLSADSDSAWHSHLGLHQERARFACAMAIVGSVEAN